MTEQPKQTISQEPATELPTEAPEASDTSVSDLDIQHPALLAHYHHLEKIGHGAQATMLKAADAQGNPVAIKVFDYQTANGWKDIELFEREIDILKDLNTEGVPKYIETIKTDKTIYLIEQYIDALSLEKQLKAGRTFSDTECVTILKHTAAILKILGNRIPPVIHRDIKPANILVDDDLNVHLVDFGVVANTAQTFSMTFAGTAGYVAPEQLYGKASPASDIFSLGATMLHLVSHVAPCDMKLKGMLPDFDRYIPDSVPSWLSDLIKKMMSADPEDRPQNGDELLKQIEAAQSKHPANSSNTPSDNRGKKILSFIFIGLLIVLAIGFAVQNNTVRIDNTNAANDTDSAEHGTNISSSDFELIERANHGDAKAQHELGNKYYFGTGMKQDRQEALKWFIKSAERGYVQAQADVAYMYDTGTGTEQNYQEAIKWYRMAAEQGHVLAQANLGDIYHYGKGVEPNYEEAAKWYKKAAEQGNTLAQGALGYLYDTGMGVEQDYDEAVKWYRKAAEKGDGPAQANLGRMYDDGKGIAQDYKEAMKWYMEAAEQGVDIQNNIGLLYQKGRGVPQNYEEAMKWYKIAADHGDQWAQRNIGLMYERGEGVEQNDEEAFQWFQKSALQGNVNAQFSLGRMYFNGKGTEENKSEAYQWFSKAAEQGNANAQNSLGDMYADGDGIEQDKYTASKWYRKAAEQGHEEAQYHLGNMYLNGEGVMMDKDEAFRWFKKAAEQGHKEAKKMLKH